MAVGGALLFSARGVRVSGRAAPTVCMPLSRKVPPRAVLRLKLRRLTRLRRLWLARARRRAQLWGGHRQAVGGGAPARRESKVTWRQARGGRGAGRDGHRGAATRRWKRHGTRRQKMRSGAGSLPRLSGAHVMTGRRRRRRPRRRRRDRSRACRPALLRVRGGGGATRRRRGRCRGWLVYRRRS